MRLNKQRLRQRCLWFLVAAASAVSPTWAQSPYFLSWPDAPTLADADEERTRATFAVDGSKVAFLVGGHLWVHEISATGALGAQLYASPPAHEVASFVWVGRNLFVSRQTGAGDETVSLTLTPQPTETTLFPFAAASMRLAPGGGKLALVPMASTVKNDTQVEFYQRDGDQWVRFGGYLSAGSGALERFWKNSYFGHPQWLYLLDWNDDGRGVFAVLPELVSVQEKTGATEKDAQEQARSPEPQVCLVLPEGVALPLSQPGRIGPYSRPNMLPMAGLVQRDGLRAVPLGHEFLSEFGPLRAPRHYLMGVQPSAWQDEYKRGQGNLIAYLPDSNYALQQMESKGGTSELIVSDLKEGRWKSLGHTPPVLTAHGWSNDGLLVRVRTKTGAVQWGLVHVPPGLLTQKEGWAKSDDGRGKPDAIAQKVLAFFKIPNVANYAPLRPIYDDFRSQAVEGEPQSFSFWGYHYAHYIRVDPRLKRVIYFDGPDAGAPLPDTPITPQKARQAALDFLNRMGPDWLRAGAPRIAVTPLWWDLNYRVRFDLAAPRPPGAPPRCVVDVRASDGHISGYTEDQAVILESWPNWQLDPRRETPLPFATLRPSPDGRFLLFRWNAPHDGYPAWWVKRPMGLYLLDLQTTGAAPQLIAMDTGAPWWSPDSRRFAFGAGGYHIYDVKTAQTQKVPMPLVQDLVPRLLGWKNADELLLGLRVNRGAMDLRIFRPDAPARFPVLWKGNWSAPLGRANGFEAAATAPDNATLAVAWEQVKPSTSVWEKVMPGTYTIDDGASLFLFPLDREDAQPRLLRSGPDRFSGIMWAKLGILSWHGRASNGIVDMTLTDPQTGKTRPWQLPAPVAERVGRLMMKTRDFLEEPGFCFSHDSKTLFFAGLEAATLPSGAKLFAADMDGHNLHALSAPPPLPPPLRAPKTTRK